MRTWILFAAVLVAPSILRAADSDDLRPASGISVIGVAETRLKPTTVEISATLTAEAELANDARVKERDARQKAIDTIQSKNPGVTLEFQGLSLNPVFDASAMAMARQQQIMIQNGMVVQMGQNGSETPRRYGVSEHVRIVLKDADKLETPKLIEAVARLIDSARDSGLQIASMNPGSLGLYSPNPTPPQAPFIVCRASDTLAARREAYKAAMEDARKKATALAELSGVKLGKVVAVNEMDAEPKTASSSPAQLNESDISSVLLGELSLNVKLGVRFEIAN